MREDRDPSLDAEEIMVVASEKFASLDYFVLVVPVVRTQKLGRQIFVPPLHST